MIVLAADTRLLVPNGQAINASTLQPGSFVLGDDGQGKRVESISTQTRAHWTSAKYNPDNRSGGRKVSVHMGNDMRLGLQPSSRPVHYSEEILSGRGPDKGSSTNKVSAGSLILTLDCGSSPSTNEKLRQEIAAALRYQRINIDKALERLSAVDQLAPCSLVVRQGVGTTRNYLAELQALREMLVGPFQPFVLPGLVSPNETYYVLVGAMTERTHGQSTINVERAGFVQRYRGLLIGEQTAEPTHIGHAQDDEQTVMDDFNGADLSAGEADEVQDTVASIRSLMEGNTEFAWAIDGVQAGFTEVMHWISLRLAWVLGFGLLAGRRVAKHRGIGGWL
ncbi:hypothetical protein CF319_g4488 [Tilletia indica]|uniref:Uncharacterized protein n=1 Tax=Tilletia indica TaxID=43049 RepID=A0A177TFD0_9BASI|nr:hypothetical protein CF319_g4488 [Tilletia indica]KAE8227769.1 hypothetical protein CF326_g7322 [Tilletia indica]KAE8256083.1 hypothetical protein A4X13_0g2830 [Tilletia indica]